MWQVHRAKRGYGSVPHSRRLHMGSWRHALLCLAAVPRAMTDSERRQECIATKHALAMIIVCKCSVWNTPSQPPLHTSEHACMTHIAQRVPSARRVPPASSVTNGAAYSRRSSTCMCFLLLRSTRVRSIGARSGVGRFCARPCAVGCCLSQCFHSKHQRTVINATGSLLLT